MPTENQPNPSGPQRAAQPGEPGKEQSPQNPQRSPEPRRADTPMPGTEMPKKVPGDRPDGAST